MRKTEWQTTAIWISGRPHSHWRKARPRACRVRVRVGVGVRVRVRVRVRVSRATGGRPGRAPGT